MFVKRLVGNIKYLIFFAFGIALDQWTKWLAIEHLRGTDGVALIPGVFKLYYLENTGAAFGILEDRSMFFVVMKVIILSVLFFLFFRVPNGKKFILLKLVLTMIATGAVGNLIDRVVHGYVVDFLYFQWIDFPVFNVADSFISVSAVALFLLLMFYYKDEDLSFLMRTNDGGKT